MLIDIFKPLTADRTRPNIILAPSGVKTATAKYEQG